MGNCIAKHQNVLFLLGSLRQQSVNKSLMDNLLNSKAFADKHILPRAPNLGRLPMFNSDLLTQKSIPKQVQTIVKMIKKAKLVIFITPEYNGSVSPLILNACQWISQIAKNKTQKRNPFENKHIGIMSCSYITQNQIKDIQILMKQANAEIFKNNFYVDLKEDPFNQQGKIVHPRIKLQLQKWAKQILKLT